VLNVLLWLSSRASIAGMPVKEIKRQRKREEWQSTNAHNLYKRERESSAICEGRGPIAVITTMVMVIKKMSLFCLAFSLVFILKQTDYKIKSKKASKTNQAVYVYI
jgi:hypothetical protein